MYKSESLPNIKQRGTDRQNNFTRGIVQQRKKSDTPSLLLPVAVTKRGSMVANTPQQSSTGAEKTENGVTSPD